MKLIVSLISAVVVADGDQTATLTCKPGYVPTANQGPFQNQTLCRDLNECKAGGVCLGPAANFCQNTDASYGCRCAEGFTLQADGQTCADNNECDDNPCATETSTECTNTYGSYTCDCLSGFTFNTTSGACEDDDECDNTSICDDATLINRACKNNPGGYTCECKSGYSKDDAGICQDDDECDTANICPRGTCVNTGGSYKCECSGQWQIDPKDATKCIDYDECANHKDNCHDPDMKAARRDNCVNTEGGFRCDCQQGYMENDEGKCVDIDECATGGDNCDINAKCKNIVMRDGDHFFTCECNEGFSGNGTFCEDIDECASNSCGVGAKCTNLIGKYTCSCVNGWRDDPDGSGCVDINECEEDKYECNGFGQGICSNTPGGYKCVCEAGYYGLGDKCFDVKECADSNKNNCDKNATCTDTDGSYDCECDDGFEGDGETCEDVNECEANKSLCIDKENMHCENTFGSYECKCNVGWRPNDESGCDDVNECWINNFSGCGGSNKGVCVNTVGSFECKCNSGYKLQEDGSCQNFDECEEKDQHCHNEAECTDEDGSFKCSCPAGFLGDGINICSDKNECVDDANICGQDLNGDTHKCKNTHGSYTCECNAGYKLNEEKNGCVDKNECNGEGVYSCGGGVDDPLRGMCSNTEGSYECKCNPMTTETGGKCEDNNECLDNGTPRTDICQGDNEECEDVLGHLNPDGYECVCEDGFERNDEGACVDVDDCPAAIANDPACANPDNIAHFGCTDTGVNSYSCGCNAGYEHPKVCTPYILTQDDIDGNGDGVCITQDDCPNYNKPLYTRCGNFEMKDGDLQGECIFSIENSGKQAGDEIPEMIDCDSEDESKCENINECLKGYDCSTNGEPNQQKCSDTDGSYDCLCNDGYSEGADGKCSDVDECYLGTHNCDPGEAGICNNLTPASDSDPKFECACIDGYDLNSDTNICTDHNECNDDPRPWCLGTSGAQQCFNRDRLAINPETGKPWGINYECGCKTGWYKEDGDSECKNYNECRGEAGAVHSCLEPNKKTCSDTTGSYKCSCSPGFKDDGSGNCINIDECDAAVDTHNCHADALCKDTEGSFECACKPGYAGNGLLCSDRNECLEEDNGCPKSNGDCENTIGSYTCGCKTGYKHPKVCTPYTLTQYDIDGNGDGFCILHSDCDKPLYPRCGNFETIGGVPGGECLFSIENSGKEAGDEIILNCDSEDDSKCVNIDECTDQDYAYDCNQGDDQRNKCRDTDGSFECDCDSGYKFGATGNCTDIDECASDDHPCHDNAKCQNIEGQAEGVFTCVCDPGYEGNGTFCGDKNECDGQNPCGNHGVCSNNVGSYTCTCKMGWRAGDPKKGETDVCVDIDECDYTQGVYSCPDNNSCSNNQGSYDCVCSKGYEACTAQGQAGPDCADGGSIGDCTNVNECSDGDNGGCGSEDWQLCKDTPGSFYCFCGDGWRMQDVNGVNQCVNINECVENDNPCPDAKSTCKDNDGSYSCPCSTGWKEENQLCVDINECADAFYPYDCPDQNQGLCRNTIGSYECDCDVGFKWNVTANACTDLDECQTQDIVCGAFSKCENIVLRDGTTVTDADGNELYKCACLDGYFGNGLLCSNINECEVPRTGADSQICGVGGVCTDNDGSYSCACNSNYKNNDDNSGCVDRNECAGDGIYICGDASRNQDPNRGQCFNIEQPDPKKPGYECKCNPGYTLNTNSGLCEDDDECTDGDDNCDENADCSNIGGSFKCTCKYGYSGSGVDGDCSDINECETIPNVCPKAHSECKNYEGRHDCPCVDGYKEKNGVCVDRDECSDNSNKCSVNANCHNTEGSYTCSCHGEYQGDGFTCLMCPSDECWSYNAADKRCEIKMNGNCTEVECGATSMTVKFAGALFGLSDDLATWASDAQPEYGEQADSNLDWSYTSNLGENGMTYVMTADNKIKFKMLVALSGNTRARSDFDLVVARQIDLGSKTLLTTPFGIGVMYTCSYPLAVTVQSSNFTAQVVSQQGKTTGVGNLAKGFEMSLNDLGPNDPVEFILGAILKIGISWTLSATSQSGLDKLSFWIDNCYVSHGSKNIYVVKQGCFANALEVTDLAGDDSRSAAFEYKLFKGVGENSATQSITCTANVCDTSKASTESGYCGKPTNSTSQCPKNGDDIYYGFKAGVGCVDGCV